MPPRPYRIYQHTFRQLTPMPSVAPLVFVRIGQTPCQAKGSAFAALEGHLLEHADLPRQGWVLHEQLDITGEVQKATGGKLR